MSTTKVKKYRGDRAMRRGVEHMARKGYTVQTQASRKAWFSLLAGVFTRKQIHTVTFIRTQKEEDRAAVPNV
jgi:hypothetical protein